MKTRKNVHYHKRVGGRLICTMASREIEPGCTNLASAVSMQLRLFGCFLQTHEDTVLPHTHTLPPFPLPSLAPSLHASFLNTVLPHLSSLPPSLPPSVPPGHSPNPKPYTIHSKPQTQHTQHAYTIQPTSEPLPTPPAHAGNALPTASARSYCCRQLYDFAPPPAAFSSLSATSVCP